MTALFLVASLMSQRPIDPAPGLAYDLPGLPQVLPMDSAVSIVDDDQGVREALQRMLQSHGIDSAVFASAEQFLGSFDASVASCLILDIRLPGMTGMALHDYLSARGCRVPTILITACPTGDERNRAIASGAASYLAKPLSEQALLDAVRKALQDAGQATARNARERSAPGL